MLIRQIIFLIIGSGNELWGCNHHFESTWLISNRVLQSIYRRLEGLHRSKQAEQLRRSSSSRKKETNQLQFKSHSINYHENILIAVMALIMNMKQELC